MATMTKKQRLTKPIANEPTTTTTLTVKTNSTTTTVKKKCDFAVGLSLQVSLP